ncbi:type VII secretion target [Actinoplanes sp. NPDC026619]|uniref:type VII secretion target n=1 Tax=Actinoplanes sp. NPDC026619 TaxID=3155798 RepID=UPI0033D189F5
MSDRLSVRQADLVTHAGHVEAIGDQIATAAGAGRAVRADNGAYGQLCVMVPPMLNLLHDILVDGLEECAEALRDTGAKLRTTAGEYDASDTFSADSFRNTS